MRKILLLTIIVGLMFADTCLLVGSIKGREYNDILKRWIVRNINLYACPNPGSPYLIETDSVLRPSATFTGRDRKRLLDAVNKAKKWAQKAKRVKPPQFSKPLFKNSKQFTLYGKRYNVFNIEFFTANNGRQNDLIFYIIDYNNQFKKDEVYVSIDKSADYIIGLLKHAQNVYKKARKAKQLAKEFK